MSKSVREQVELFCRAHDRDPDDEWGDSGLLATTIIAANHELFASAEETVAELADLKARIEPVKHLFANAESKLDEFASLQQENARLTAENELLRAFQEDDSKHYRQMCELVGADYDCMTGGHEHLVSYLEGYAGECAENAREVARLRGVIEEAGEYLSRSTLAVLSQLRAALSPQPVQGGGE